MAYTGEQVKTGQVSGGIGVQSLADTALGSNAASVIFSGISGSYIGLNTDWQARGSSTGSGGNSGDQLRLQVNGVSSSDYWWAIGSIAAAAAIATDQGAGGSSRVGVITGSANTAGDAATGSLRLQNYTGATFGKNWTSVSGVGHQQNMYVGTGGIDTGGLSAGTAITSLKFFPESSPNLITGSRFTLQGDQ